MFENADLYSTEQMGENDILMHFHAIVPDIRSSLTPPQSRCSYSILHLKLFSFFTKNITELPSETAKLHQENGRQYDYRHKHGNVFKAG